MFKLFPSFFIPFIILIWQQILEILNPLHIDGKLKLDVFKKPYCVFFDFIIQQRKEAEKIEKLNTAAKEKQVQESLDASEAAQKKEVSVKSASDMDRVAENKEARLNALKEKLEKKKQHAERVRLVRLARQAEGGPSQETDMQQSKDDITGNGTPAV